jgi:hypothetical protein
VESAVAGQGAVRANGRVAEMSDESLHCAWSAAGKAAKSSSSRMEVRRMLSVCLTAEV